MLKAVWIAFAAGNLADALTFARMSAATVADQEMNALARALGSGFLPGLVCKGGLVLLMLALSAYLARLDAPRWVFPAVLLVFAAGGFYGAYTNVAYGWS